MDIGTKEILSPPHPIILKNGTTLSFDSPLVMGIVNITPDSFYDGGYHNTTEKAIHHIERLISEGADIIDLGAASTRPGAEDIGQEEELNRLMPVLSYMVNKYPEVPVSIDTYHSAVAWETIKNGASIVNDISGGSLDINMFNTIGELNVPYILMHIQGNPKNMQVSPTYTDVTEEVYQYFASRISELKSAGASSIIIDPGFGFGKSVDHNYELLRNLNRFKDFELPIMAGLSRKSMINKVLKTKPENALTGTIALNTLAILQGANILRVHDVKEAKQVIELVKQYQPKN
jgi:dihydropteroate synthase